MNPAAVGTSMPRDITLDDVAAMAAADENHRYELSREGVLFVLPPADPEHALIVMKLAFWLAQHGFTAEQVAADCGIDVGGGRVPDLTVWAKDHPPRPARSSYAGIDGLLLAVEVVSTGSEIADKVIKKNEYASAGVPRYWIVDRQAGNRVTMWQLVDGVYVAAAGESKPLQWLLNSLPDIAEL
jgi:Uma2 family endonuclease